MRFRMNLNRHYTYTSPIKKAFANIFVAATLLAGTCLMLTFLYQDIQDAEHYSRIWERPLTVEATVTKHEAYDDEGDTDFYIYVSYEANGKQYSNIRYRSVDTKTDLIPIGETLDLEVSPENPATLLKNLRNTSGFYMEGIVLTILLGCAYNALVKRMRSRGHCEKPDEETILRDLKLTLWANPIPPAAFLLAVAMAALCLRYPMLFGTKTAIFAGVCALVGVMAIVHVAKSLGKVRNGEYTVRRDTLLEKKESSDSDGTSYTLIFSSDGRTWEKNVSAREYYLAQEGQAVYAVYLGNKKRPALHYDRFGKTH